MRTETAIAHFGSRTKLARALEISQQAISQWGEAVPEGTAYKLQVLTAGRLRVDPRLYEKRHTA